MCVCTNIRKYELRYVENCVLHTCACVCVRREEGVRLWRELSNVLVERIIVVCVCMQRNRISLITISNGEAAHGRATMRADTLRSRSVKMVTKRMNIMEEERVTKRRRHCGTTQWPKSG